MNALDTQEGDGTLDALIVAMTFGDFVATAPVVLAGENGTQVQIVWMDKDFVPPEDWGGTNDQIAVFAEARAGVFVFTVTADDVRPGKLAAEPAHVGEGHGFLVAARDGLLDVLARPIVVPHDSPAFDDVLVGAGFTKRDDGSLIASP